MNIISFNLQSHLQMRYCPMDKDSRAPSNALGAALQCVGAALATELSPRRCKNCSNEFTPTRKWQEFCRPQCRSQFFWKRHKRLTVPVEPATSADNTESVAQETS
jgi:hypothetical protein